MSLLDKTVLNLYQDKLATDEKRYDKQGLIKAFVGNTPSVEYMSNRLIEKLKTFSSERTFEIPVIKDGEVSVTFTPGFDNLDENMLESDVYGFTAVDICTKFSHYPAQFAENVIDAAQSLMIQAKRADNALADEAEKAIITVLENNKTHLIDYLTQANMGEGTYAFDVPSKTLTVDKAGIKDTMYYDLNNIADNNLLERDSLLITSKGGTNEIVKQYNKYGAGNELNKAWGRNLIEEGKIFETHNISPSTDAFNGYLVQEGAVGIYANHPFDFRQGTKLGEKEWSVSDTPLAKLGLKVNVFIDRNAVDASPKIDRGTDSVMTTRETMYLWTRFYITHPYNSDPTSRVSEIIKLKGLTS